MHSCLICVSPLSVKFGGHFLIEMLVIAVVLHISSSFNASGRFYFIIVAFPKSRHVCFNSF